jgi:hypothetical protein
VLFPKSKGTALPLGLAFGCWSCPIGCLGLCGSRWFFATRNKQPMATNLENVSFGTIKKTGWCGGLGGLVKRTSAISLRLPPPTNIY